jgi:hypothetical protein
MCNFAAVKQKLKKMTRIDLLSILITIRLREVAGGDKVCI